MTDGQMERALRLAAGENPDGSLSRYELRELQTAGYVNAQPFRLTNLGKDRLRKIKRKTGELPPRGRRLTAGTELERTAAA